MSCFMRCKRSFSSNPSRILEALESLLQQEQEAQHCPDPQSRL